MCCAANTNIAVERPFFLAVGTRKHDVVAFTQLHEIPLRQYAGQVAFHFSDRIIMKISPQPVRLDVRVHARKRRFHKAHLRGIGELLFGRYRGIKFCQGHAKAARTIARNWSAFRLRAADQGAVHIGLVQQRRRVVRLDAAAVLDDERLRPRPRRNSWPMRPRTKACASWACSRRRVAAGADGPDRLVGDHHAAPASPVDAGETAGQLRIEHRLGAIGLALLQRLADAQDDVQARRRARRGPCG